jgi:hypothetical protein
MLKPFRLLTLLACSLFASAAISNAQMLFGLGTNGTTLTVYNSPTSPGQTTTITGLNAGDTLVDIDVFVSGNGQLYGMGTSGTLYTITPGAVTSMATVNSGPVYNNIATGSPLSLGTPTVIDFNPAVNRLRVYSGTQNFRVTPNTGNMSPTGNANNDGTLAYEAGDPNAGATPTLGAAAYLNNFAGATPAQAVLYSIDTTLNTLVLNVGGPQFSALRTLGQLTLNGMMFDVGTNVGFDILSIGGSNTAYLSNGNALYTVNLNMGQVGGPAGELTFISTLSGAGIRSIAVVPEPSTYALLGVGALALLVGWKRRRSAAA